MLITLKTTCHNNPPREFFFFQVEKVTLFFYPDCIMLLTSTIFIGLSKVFFQVSITLVHDWILKGILSYSAY